MARSAKPTSDTEPRSRPEPTSRRRPAQTEVARPYHHGDLRRAVLDAAADAIEADGSASLSLRDLARRLGVSHAAPAHHFGDKTGLLTALAAEGYELLAEAQAEAWERTHDFLEVGVAYVRFALDHPAHFEVMYRPDLLHEDDPALLAARARSSAFLYGPAGELVGDDARSAGIAGWALVHGIVSLFLSGNLPPELGDDPVAITRLAGRHLFSTPGTTDELTPPGADRS